MPPRTRQLELRRLFSHHLLHVFFHLSLAANLVHLFFDSSKSSSIVILPYSLTLHDIVFLFLLHYPPP